MLTGCGGTGACFVQLSALPSSQGVTQRMDFHLPELLNLLTVSTQSYKLKSFLLLFANYDKDEADSAEDSSVVGQ